MTLPAWPPGPPSRSETVEALLAERAELIAENHTLRFKSSTLAAVSYTHLTLPTKRIV